MQFLRQYRFVLLFFVLLVFSSVMVVRQLNLKQHKQHAVHVERREAFVLLQARGYTNESARLYQKLLLEMPRISNRELIEDFQRTLLLVDPYSQQTNNLIWNYHWTVSNELDRRSESTLVRARKLAEEDY